MENQLCSIETCNICTNNKYGTIIDNGHLIDLRLLRKFNANINGNKKG